MELDVRGKVAFITGAAEGIGEKVALILGKEGVDIAVADMNYSKVEAVSKKIVELGVKSLFFKVDVTRQDEVEQAVQATISNFKKIDILIHIPGRGERKPFSISKKEDWDFAINLNLYGALNSTKAVIGQMMKQQSGSIVFVVSDAGRVGQNNNPIYSAAKGGVIAFSKALAQEQGRYKIRVNCISLSAMNTPGGIEYLSSLANKLGIEKAELEKRMLSNYCIRRFGEPEDAANAICFIASGRADWITGQTLSVNGGYCMV